jgi:hypothetical protein
MIKMRCRIHAMASLVVGISPACGGNHRQLRAPPPAATQRRNQEEEPRCVVGPAAAHALQSWPRRGGQCPRATGRTSGTTPLGTGEAASSRHRATPESSFVTNLLRLARAAPPFGAVGLLGTRSFGGSWRPELAWSAGREWRREDATRMRAAADGVLRWRGERPVRGGLLAKDAFDC